jgi:hypothetical protein
MINWLMLFIEIISVYSKDYIKKEVKLSRYTPWWRLGGEEV